MTAARAAAGALGATSAPATWSGRGTAANEAAPQPAQDRPHKLPATAADLGHVEPRDDATTARFQARADRLQRLGFGQHDAAGLAQRLHLRDVQADHRHLCLECIHLAGHRSTTWRCGNHRRAGVGRDLAGDLATTLQDCPGFTTA